MALWPGALFRAVRVLAALGGAWESPGLVLLWMDASCGVLAALAMIASSRCHMERVLERGSVWPRGPLVRFLGRFLGRFLERRLSPALAWPFGGNR